MMHGDLRTLNGKRKTFDTDRGTLYDDRMTLHRDQRTLVGDGHAFEAGIASGVVLVQSERLPFSAN